MGSSQLHDGCRIKLRKWVTAKIYPPDHPGEATLAILTERWILYACSAAPAAQQPQSGISLVPTFLCH